MLTIKNAGTEVRARTLMHSDTVFHEALDFVRNGEKAFHVVCPDGEDYCLVYQKNEEIQRVSGGFPNAPLFQENALFPDYLQYDETDRDFLYLDIFSPYTGVYLEEMNEYSIVILKLLLELTDKTVYTSDSRYRRFLRKKYPGRIIQVNQPEIIPDESVMLVRNGFVFDTLVGKYDRIDPICLFHNIFVMQYVKSLFRPGIRRLTVNIPKTEGIGSILNNFFRIRRAAARHGVNVGLKSNCTRYSDEVLRRYFRIQIDEPDADSVPLDDLFTVAFTHMIVTQKYVLSADILSEKFLADMNVYKRAAFHDKRMLGVLVRGTDYIASNMPIQPLPVDEVIPLIEDAMSEGSFDGIFLATEDLDYHEQLTSHFRGRICTIPQRRFRVADLRDTVFLSNLEKVKSQEKDYDHLSEDTLGNYFYAIYLLSECQGFIGMPADCNGVLMTREFNGGRFELIRLYTKNV